MGDLIVMSRAKPLPPRERVAGHSAEILFFTGVRYYRMDEAPDTATRATTRPKRRRSPEQRRAARRAREQRIEALA